MFYKQCVLEKKLGQWSQRQTAWIPENLAHVFQTVKLLVQRVQLDSGNAEEVWDDGWTITEVGTRMDEEYVRGHERDHMKQAQASDMVRDEDGHWKKVGA